MDSNRIKRLATGARASLMAGVSASLERVLAPDSPEALAHPNEVAELREVARTDERGLVERVAYTWFNRLCALRFMDVRGYTEVPVVSPREGRTLPAMLDDARRGTFPGYVPQAERQRIASLLSEGSSSANPLGEAFVALLLAACDSWAKPMPMLFGADVRTRAAMRLLAPADLLSEGSVLARVREGMDEGDCQDVEVMGWLYQYYIAERKDEVFEGFRHSKKAGPDELGPATQLFTPSWIVRYMVENSLGRLWMLNFPSSRLRERMDYYIEPEGEVENFIRIGSPEEITLCDPACGSGHILVYAFDLLFDMYLEEGYRAADIPALILSKNLSGMEIDSRAAEIASFALEMKARERDDDFFSRGVNDDITVLEPVAFEPAETASLGLLAGNARLLDAFSHLGEVGSLYVPDPTDSVLVGSAIDSLRARDDMESAATLGKLELMATSLEALSRTFDAVVANPPYMGSKNMSPWMSSWVKDNYPDEKSDLFSAFILRNTFFCKQDGELGFMTPFVWMFISAYEKLRNLLINQGTITSLIQLEYSGFSGATVPVCTFTLHNGLLKNYRGGYVRLANFVGPAVQQPKALEAIRNHGCGWFYRCDARSFKDIPGSPVAYWASLAEKSSFINGKLLKQVVPTHAGISTGDNNAFLRLWQEVSARDISIFGGKNYSPHIKGGEYRKWFGNREYILKYDSKSLERMGSLPGFRHDGNQFYFKPMISWPESSEQVQRLAVVYLPGAPPAVALAWPAVEVIVRLPDLLVADGRKVRALREVLPEEPVGVLVGPPLPRVVREAEVHRRPQGVLQLGRRRELRAPVQRHGPDDLPGQRPLHHRVHVRARAGRRLAADEVAARPVDLRDQARPAGPADDGVPLPVADARAPLRLRRALRDLVGGPDLAPALLGAPRVPALAAVPEPPAHGLPAGQLAVQRPGADGAADGAGAHRLGRRLGAHPARHLLRGPVPVADEGGDQGAPGRVAEGPGSPAGEPPRVRPRLRGGGPVDAPGRRRRGPPVPRDLPRDGGLVPPDFPRDAAHALVVPPADHDVLALLDAKMAVAAHGSPSNDRRRKRHCRPHGPLPRILPLH